MFVNMGPRRASKLIQLAVNEYFDNSVLAVDGILGNQSRNAMDSIKYPRQLLHFIRGRTN